MTSPDAAPVGPPRGAPHDPPYVVGLQVGQPERHVMRSGRAYVTGFWKTAVQGPRWLSELGVDGDGQADLVHHGGMHKAILLYAVEHYASWSAELEAEPFPPGGFGENASVLGVTEADVCIGDVWRIGEALVEVSQPRQPCWKLDERWGRSDLVERTEATGRTGWYHRVVEEGFVGPGDRLELVDRPRPEWSVARANDVMHHHGHDRDMTAELSAVPELSPSWRLRLAARLEGIDDDRTARRTG